MEEEREELAWGHLTLSLIVWIVIGTMVFFNWIDFKLLTHHIKPMGSFSPEFKAERGKEFSETLVTLYFTHADSTFDHDNNWISVHLLHKTRIRVASFRFHLKYSKSRRDFCLNKYERLFFVVRNAKPLPFITRIRATHESAEQKIFFEGIETLDYDSNLRAYYPVREWIRGGTDITQTKRLYVKPQLPRFLSHQTFCLSHENPVIYEFGEELVATDKSKKKSKYDEEINGVRIPSKIHWYETCTFNSMIFALTFVANISILISEFKNINESNSGLQLILAVIFPGLISVTITEGLAYIYVKYLVVNYEKSQSKMAEIEYQKNDWLNLWPILTTIYLLFVIMTAILSTLVAQLMPFAVEEEGDSIAKRYRFEISGNHSFDELIFIYMVFIMSSVLAFTFWRFVFGCVRYIFRQVTFQPKILRMKKSGANTPDIIEDGCEWSDTKSPPETVVQNQKDKNVPELKESEAKNSNVQKIIPTNI